MALRLGKGPGRLLSSPAKRPGGMFAPIFPALPVTVAVASSGPFPLPLWIRR